MNCLGLITFEYIKDSINFSLDFSMGVPVYPSPMQKLHVQHQELISSVKISAVATSLASSHIMQR